MRLIRKEGMPAIVEPYDKDPLSLGAVYLGPPNYHILVDKTSICLSTDDHVLHSRPSVNVLFESAARSFGAKATCLVLSGSNEDGAEGAAVIARRGGQVLIQTPETSSASTMPQAALDAVPKAKAIALNEISDFLRSKAFGAGFSQ